MPPDHELYYGFTRFAMELNELEPGMREILPHTDTRLRYMNKNFNAMVYGSYLLGFLGLKYGQSKIKSLCCCKSMRV